MFTTRKHTAAKREMQNSRNVSAPGARESHVEALATPRIAGASLALSNVGSQMAALMDRVLHYSQDF